MIVYVARDRYIYLWKGGFGGSRLWFDEALEVCKGESESVVTKLWCKWAQALAGKRKGRLLLPKLYTGHLMDLHGCPTMGKGGGD